MASNRNALKKYAPQARMDFIQAMINRAAQFGITKSSITQGVIQGDLYILNGKAFPRAVAEQRDRLTSRIARDGFDQVMEAIAYTWFNRFLAIRYMEIHDYFDHGFRVLSHPEGHDEPQILEQIAKVDLPGLKREEIVSLKIDGTKDEQIYRKILIAQCNDLHRAMPFLFERIDDETELLLPENLLQSDSIVRKLVTEIDEAEWQEIEIIGWLYQYYISDKKDEVIGKVVKSEDIPAATQLFTPNWIVKYMVQNSLGAQWLATYPNSSLRGEMEYYIAPGEQTPAVQAQLDALTPKELDPESITLIDPAVGSGHILVEAYNLFRTIYLERGYTRKEAARAILTKNLFGLDIDTRAAQMAGFALLMKARADDRTLLRDTPRINVLAIMDSQEMDADALTLTLVPDERLEIVPSGDLLPETLPQPTLATRRSNSKEGAAIRALIAMFDGADTFGSLITVPQNILDSLDMIEAHLTKPISSDLLRRQAQLDARDQITPLVHQARLLGGRYDCVLANPPYMASNYINSALKSFLSRNYADFKSDMFSSFVSRCLELNKSGKHLGFVTPFTWLYISNFKTFRRALIEKTHFTSMVKPSYTSFYESAIVPLLSFCLRNKKNLHYKSKFFDLGYLGSAEEQPTLFKKRISDDDFSLKDLDSFTNFEGLEFAFAMPEPLISAIRKKMLLKHHFSISEGLKTGKNDLFIRFWHEVSMSRRGLWGGGKKWIPHSKGGDYRRWYGNLNWVVNWDRDGRTVKEFPSSGAQGEKNYGNVGVTWSKISTSFFGVRILPAGMIFDSASPALFALSDISAEEALPLLSSKPVELFVKSINPTLNFQVGNIGSIPLPPINDWKSRAREIGEAAVTICKADWDGSELSWEFSRLPLIDLDNLSDSYNSLRNRWRQSTSQLLQLENDNNLIFISAYGLQDEVTPELPLKEVTLTCNPHFRYGGDLSETEREERLKSDTMRELISYAVGCAMGRYSLSEQGLIYAESGGIGFDPARYRTFPADEDGIIPVTYDSWFEEDAATRIEEFLAVAWPKAPVMETLSTLADGLTMGKGGEPRDALRGYLSKQFFKDHLQTYKNRPIYWLFSSGKQKAFEALVYLHRYNEGTLARMRTNYVTPLMGKLQQRINDLEAEVASSPSSAEKARKTKEKDKFGKQLVELRRFDEELRHLADQRIAIDLDDGVKVNYAKFGNLLSGVDKICGKDKDD